MHAAEASPFETSEMLAGFLSSTPLLSESWGLCSLANVNSRSSNGFLTEQIGTTGYVAFSGVQFDSPGAGFPMTSDSTCRNLVPLDDVASCNSIFSPINGRYEGEEKPVMVHARSLWIFLSMCENPIFQSQMNMLRQKSKSIVVTGHSMGGSIASLCALWLLSCPQFSGLSVFCITFGSPLLGNVALSRAVLRERWGGHFCHVVSKYDLMPRVLLTPLPSIVSHLHSINQYLQLSMTSSRFGFLAGQLNDQCKAEMFSHVSVSLDVLLAQAEKGTMTGTYWPFGSYFFCSEEGAICLDNAISVIKMMQSLFAVGSPSCCIEDHLKYGAYIGKASSEFQEKRNFMQKCPESSYEAGLWLALQSVGIACQEAVARPAEDYLKMARRMGYTPNLKCANLAIKLSKITPYRAEIQWYQESCNQSDDQIGYYDSFKQRGASKRGSKVNMNRHKLARFWDNVIKMLENNELPHDFLRRSKWVKASHFYKLLVEPLDIAEYYRTGMNHVKGHYISHGRERRYQIFDRWWEETVREKENNKRSKFASLTQDSCFWARLEEAREWLDYVRTESNLRTLASLWEKIVEFQRYASELVEKKEVSKDVVAKNSSYSIWVRDFQELKLQMTQFHTHF
uniref:Lipase-like PAD4 n=1 Tax=Rhizophora mucronata TaxID=61149 RepID=A0A2P2KZ26_RHIMU